MEEFQTQQDRSDGTVCHSSKETDHTAGGHQAWFKMNEITVTGSEAGSDGKRRYDLAAFKASTDSECGKKNLQEKSFYLYVSFHALQDQIDTASTVHGGSQEDGQNDKSASACQDSEIGVGNPLF